METIESVIAGVAGCKCIGLTCRTRPKLNRSRKVQAHDNHVDVFTNPYPPDSVEKISKVQGLIGYDHQHSLQKEDIRRGGDGDIAPAGQTWGAHETSAIVVHNERKYVQVKVQNINSRYFVNGEEIDVDLIKGFMPVKKDTGVKTVRYALDNIEELRYNHQVYKKHN